MPFDEMAEKVYATFQKSVEAKIHVGEDLAPQIAFGAHTIVQALLDDKKILVCGNAASAALAEMFTATLIDRFERERPSLPAICLGSNISSYTSISSEYSVSEVFAKPVRALGQEGDILIVISTSGNSSNLIQAIGAAHDRNMRVIALSGRDGGNVSTLLSEDDVEICAHIDSRGRIHEIHMLALFCICDLIDFELFG